MKPSKLTLLATLFTPSLAEAKPMANHCETLDGIELTVQAPAEVSFINSETKQEIKFKISKVIALGGENASLLIPKDSDTWLIHDHEGPATPELLVATVRHSTDFGHAHVHRGIGTFELNLSGVVRYDGGWTVPGSEINICLGDVTDLNHKKALGLAGNSVK